MERTYCPTLFSVTALLLIQYCCMQASLAINNAATNITTDQSALLALKARIDFYNPNNVLANNWSTNAPVCNWIGISCGSRHHRVTALNLAHMRLEGTIPPHLGNLSFLVRLIIRNNSFHGSLPPELSLLRRLKVFNFGSNKLNGEIPSWIGLLTRLQSLFLYANSFTGSMPSMISNLSSLQLLDLSSNRLSGRLTMEKFDNLPNLLAISATYNQFHGELPSTLYNCKQLQILSLSVNNLSGRLPPQIGNLTMLTQLFLAYNNFEGAIPSEIGKLQNLESLSLFHNSFEGPIPLEIFNISTIQMISMPMNKLSGRLPSSIGLFLPNLQQLFLGQNQLSGPIPSSITNASQLTKLYLTKNSFSGLIPKSLGNLRLLRVLNLPFNNLTVESSELSNLFFDLSNCIYLESLDLSENPLNVILPSSIGNLSTSLQRFILGNCKIKGNIPTDIGEFNNLDTLGLYNNELTGSLPATLGKLYKLQGLYLDHNRLEGLVPSNICHLKTLFALYLDHNKLSGHIPTCISNLTFLRGLYFSFNQLTSTIPLSLWSLTDLLEIDLSSNSFNGSLSWEIEDMKVLTKLDISRNQLSGGIPNISFKDMVYLSLARNQLEGSIPESFGEMVSLVVLNLSHNNLSGEIPKSLEALQYLKFLNVSFNRLQGEIPTGGPFVNLTAASFLSNYALCGAPQLQVAPCKEVHHHHHHRRILMYVLLIVGLTILVTFLVIVKKRWRKRNAIKSQVVEELSLLATWKRISHLELQPATEGFNQDNLIGKGSFGFVYKGTLSDGMDVAIKVLNLEVEGGFKSFDAECLVLRNIRHRNLVKIISACSSMNFRAFVLEYMPNGNLETWLYNRCLNMLQRLNIMTDVAAALEYLHFGLSSPIIHCDLKPSNVLLDAEMVAHVADFGMAKLLDDGDSLTRTMTLASMGYMAPEYGSEGIISTRGDAYSYGILLMEIFTRKKPTDDMFSGEINLKSWVEESLPLSINEVVDTNLLRNERDYAAMEGCLSSVMRLALICCADSPQERMDMKTVSVTLDKIKSKFLRDTEAGGSTNDSLLM
ncbi:probable LRR receptor-like serine/threonine-protein kinase At3g47570 [Juglans microcarpa x Juglans regia]|uniref:probable LRR receptor-like serine/threonine-protein kinase At3g47570 n=1 Tax=Juglans microcarpa x Juglans regia TaxID=2249226 RepID=UPI001B7F0ACE|nr:probable LRR receptor-like serine/threonine-protein kinase At3g47570 [Juglans microcarpa x Juglans regia]